MPEIRKDAKVEVITYDCDVCENGTMQFTGTVFPTSPQRYGHRCDVCKTEQNFYVSYPRKVFTPIENNED